MWVMRWRRGWVGLGWRDFESQARLIGVAYEHRMWDTQCWPTSNFFVRVSLGLLASAVARQVRFLDV
jgi:hypothetical protein